ncbi:MAG TPA: hypothetical protein VFD58_00270 [Blastocatellia bacterium]|nr:hypothetical protein [Blastocatellia bacterium]
MSKRILCLCGLTIFVAGLAAGRLSAGNGPQSKVLLDNQRVTVTEITMPPAAAREPYTRPSDQIIVFIDDADYEATDAAGKKQTKHRQPGEIVWHDKGEAAPLLINKGSKPYRNLVIALK